MSMTDWAENEVKLACERERKGSNNNEWTYVVACYESALKAYKSLLEDAHSGMSFSITKSILNRLMDEIPLTPIEDVPEVWNEVCYLSEGDGVQYQCKRKYSLFKTVCKDGSVSYRDINQSYCIDAHNPNNSYHSNLIQKQIVEKMFPIKMPYIPQNPIKVYVEDFSTDTKNGDFDTIVVHYIIKPDGERINVLRYFAENDGRFEEISETVCDARRAMARKRKEEKDNGME